MGTFLEIKDLDTVRELKLIRWIDPKKIKYLAKNEFRVDSLAEHHCDGDWDQETSLFDDGEVYQAFNDVFIRGIPWTETKFYISGRLQKYEIQCETEEVTRSCQTVNFNHSRFTEDEAFDKAWLMSTSKPQWSGQRGEVRKRLFLH